MVNKLRAGLVGTGNIAEHHVAALRGLAGVEIVGVTDLDAARAKAFAERFGLRALPSLEALRADAGADVVHVLTPPASHADVACAALDLGCHVLVEKPLATSVADCQRVQDKARDRGLTASVNHSLLYDPQVVRALETVRAGKLGTVVAVDILRGSMYPPFRSGRLPPQYRDPAYPFRDLGVHAFYLFEAFLGRIEQVDAMWDSKGGDPNLAFDEWRAMVRCKNGLGQVQLSWNVKPMQSQLVIQGTRGVLRVDLFLMFQALRKALPLPKPAERIVNALTDSIQPLVDVPIGVVKFATKRVKPFHGLHGLVGAYYRALEGKGDLPVTLAEATSVVRWVEEVAQEAEADHAARLAQLPPLAGADVLVTGAGGALGGEVLRKLAGRKVRILVRRMPDPLPPGVEVVLGDLGDPDAIERAVKGVRDVVHVGAAMKGAWEDHERGTVDATRLLVDACLRHGVRKLVHVSSMSVVDWAGNDHGTLTEASAYEPRPDERGFYTRAKLEAEKIVLAAVRERGLRAVVLRPGQIFGGRIPLVTPAVARRAGRRWLVLGNGELRLPLVYMDDVVQAIATALDGPLEGGEVVQLVDAVTPTQNEVLRAVAPGTPVLHFPRPLLFFLGWVSQVLLGLLKRPSPVAPYRLRSALARLEFASSAAGPALGWRPEVGVVEGVRRTLGEAPAAALATIAARHAPPVAPAEPVEVREKRSA